MTYSEQLADRIRDHLGDLEFDETRIMDGLGFFVGDRMAVGVLDDCLCLHVDEKSVLGYVGQDGVDRYEFAGVPVPGWLAITETVLDEAALTEWITLGLKG